MRNDEKGNKRKYSKTKLIGYNSKSTNKLNSFDWIFTPTLCIPERRIQMIKEQQRTNNAIFIEDRPYKQIQIKLGIRVGM